MKLFARLMITGLICVCGLICFSQDLPIKSARTISFKTDEGTNIDVDISPDGKNLVFTLLGDLYMMPATGGTAKQITRGLAVNMRPAYSPEGKRIAYLSDASGEWSVHVRDVAGKFDQVLEMESRPNEFELQSSFHPIWTPDGNHIVLGQTIYSLAGDEVPLSSGKRYIGYSHDGLSVYAIDSEKICRYDKEVRTVLTDVERWHSFALAPNGRWLASIQDTGGKKCLIATDLVNRVKRMLVPSLYVNFSFSHQFIMTQYAFSHDSKNLYIAYGGRIHHIVMETGEDKVVPFSVDVHADLGPLDYNKFRITHDSVHVRYTRSAQASPDGKQLAFTALGRIYIMDLPHGKPRILSYQPFLTQSQPAWSPDGQWVAYVSWGDTTAGFVWKVRPHGGTPEKITAVPGQYQCPAWSPDGEHMAVIRVRPGTGFVGYLGQLDGTFGDVVKGDLVILSLKGEPEKPVDAVPFTNQIAFSPDGRRLIYQPVNDPGSPWLISKDLSNGEFKPIVATWPGVDMGRVQQRSLSPDGRWIVFSMGEELYLGEVCDLPGTFVTGLPQRTALLRFATGVDPHWEAGGGIISWSYGNHFYRISLDKVLTSAQGQKGMREAWAYSKTIITRIAPRPDLSLPLKITAASNYGHGAVVLKGCRIITMKDQDIIEDGTLVVKDGKILAVGSRSKIPIPAGAQIIETAGATIMPGFVDMHLHLRTPRNNFPQQSWMYLASLAYGVTTARDPASSFDSYGYAELLRTGQMIGPRLYPAGLAVLPFSDAGTTIDDTADATTAVNHKAVLGGVLVKQYTLTSRVQKQALVQASRRAGLNMTNEGDYFWLGQIAMIKDGSSGIEHAADWGDTYGDVLHFMARSGTYLTPTLQVRYGNVVNRDLNNLRYWPAVDEKMGYFIPARELQWVSRQQPADTVNKGFSYPAFIYAQIRLASGKVAMGSHGDQIGTAVHNEIWALQSGGLTNLQALQAATIIGAEGLGMQQDIGSLEPGKIADLLILNKNPLDDIHNTREIRYVMKDGILYDGNTLDEVWPSVRRCPEWKLPASFAPASATK